MEEVKSAPLKAAPNGFEPTSPEARAALAALVKDSFDWFKGLVRERRHLDASALDAVSDGKVFTGRQALSLKLIDAVGSEQDAITWLEQEKHVTRNLPVRDWRKRASFERLGILGVAAQAAALLGFDELSAILQKAGVAADPKIVDGLMSVWHAGSIN